MPHLSAQELAIFQRLKDDLPHYASRCLKIRTKGGSIEPLLFSSSQMFVHERIEQQRAAKGYVRAIILKGRQQFISTYVGARYYHRATHARGQRVFILTHEDAATQNLFEMVERFHEHCPSLVKPATGAANAKELSFVALDSGYKVGTAGTRGVGRSSTIQMFHASEAAFWPNAETHAAGVMQAVPLLPGTEIILESTANGVGNFFHQRWRDAESGIGEYVPIFIPWFWQDEYRMPVPAGTAFDEEELEYGERHGLVPAQLMWRRNKLLELKDPLLFQQEFPATPHEAFVTTGHDSYIKPDQVLRARREDEAQPFGPKVMGVDPSRFGNDRFAIALRQGRVVPWVEYRAKVDVVSGANWVRQEIDREHPDRVFIDVGGLGAGIFDILMSWGAPYSRIVVAVNFGAPAQDEFLYLEDGSKRPGPRNRRAEMWMRSRDWLDDVGGVSLPDDDGLQADACGPGYSYDMNQRLLLEPKEKMRSRGLLSPDGWDAVALTFAEPVGDRSLAWDDDEGFDFADESRSLVTGY